jgi:Uncharacterized conserved protein (DUF2183)
MAALFSFVQALKPHVTVDDVAITNKDEVWLLDNTAYRSSPSAPWSAEFVIAFFRHHKSTQDKISDAAMALMHVLGITDSKDKATHDRILERIAPFVRPIGSKMTVDVIYEQNAEGVGQISLGPSDANGICTQILTLPIVDPKTSYTPTPAAGPLYFKVLAKETESDKTLTSSLEMGTTYLAEDGGWGVISDLDDTVKISCVNNHHLLLQNTFVNIPEHSHGLPELYKAINSAISTEAQAAPFFYVSASPYNLYPFLRKFLLGSAYPNGTIMLRDMSWENLHSWFSIKTDSLFHALPVKTYKDERFVRFFLLPFPALPLHYFIFCISLKPFNLLYLEKDSLMAPQDNLDLCGR